MKRRREVIVEERIIQIVRFQEQPLLSLLSLSIENLKIHTSSPPPPPSSSSIIITIITTIIIIMIKYKWEWGQTQIMLFA